MRSRSPERASELLGFVKNGDLRGFVGDDVQLAAQHATELGTVRWELVPRGEDTAVVEGASGSLPLAVYREAAREDRDRMDAVAEVVHDEAEELQQPRGKPATVVQKVLFAGGYPSFATPAAEIARIRSKPPNSWLPNSVDFQQAADDTKTGAADTEVFSATDEATFFGGLASGSKKIRRVAFIGHGFGGVLSGGLGLSGDTPSSSVATEEINANSFPKFQQGIDSEIKP
jgi:hypothetical protein